MNEKQTWIENQLDTEQFVSRVSPSQDLLHRLRAIPGQVKSGYDRIPKRFVWVAAASIAILICVNLFSVSYYQKSKAESESASASKVHDPFFNYLKQL